MKEIAMILVGMLMLLGCEKKFEPYFTLEEAESYLTEDDKTLVGECVRWIKKYDAVKAKEDDASRKIANEYFSKAVEPIKKRYSEARDDTSPKGVRRSAALAWVMIDFMYNNFNGTCAVWVIFASELGLIEAIQIRRNPPDEDLMTYLLPPEEQNKWREARKAAATSTP